MTAPDTPDMTARDTLSLRGAATACGLSESTIRRNREKLKQYGAKQDKSGWHIPRSALIAAGLLTAPDTPDMTAREGSQKINGGSPVDSHPKITVEALRDELVGARAEAREWRARAEERGREREQLIKRAESAEATAREATATATALALTVKELQSTIRGDRDTHPHTLQNFSEMTPEPHTQQQSAPVRNFRSRTQKFFHKQRKN